MAVSWRIRFFWVRWVLASFFSALVAVPIGYAVAVVVAQLLSLLLSFLWVIGALIGIIIGGAVGGAIAGIFTSLVQRAVLPGTAEGSGDWGRRGGIAWGLVGTLGIVGVVPITRGDLSPVIPIAFLGALLTGVAHWAALKRQLRHAAWWMLSGTCALVIGSILGSAVLGGMTERGARDTVLTALSAHESLEEVKGLQLIDFEGTLLFFVAKEDVYQNTRWELWISDGTPDGTMLVEPGHTGWNQPSITDLISINSSLLFSANGTEDKANAQSWMNGVGVWRTDGTASGTSKLAIPGNPWLSDAVEADGRVFYQSGGVGTQRCVLWVSDGTAAGTRQVTEFKESCLSRATAFGGALFFQSDEPVLGSAGCALWASDGTVAGTRPIKQFGAPDTTCIRYMAVLGDRLVIGVLKASGHELWISDGTEAGTTLVRALPDRFPKNQTDPVFMVAHERVFFATLAGSAGDGCALWSSDGTSAGTVEINRICTGQSIVVGDALMFLVESTNHSWELWRSDGTSGGTQQVRGGFTTGREGYLPRFLLVDRTTVYLKIHDQAGCAVWKSDGTAAGTVEIRRGCPDQITVVSGTLYFVIQHSEREIELWKSDGTVIGTVLVKVIS
jgi:ELWxxDGT repeat protein